jgi:hypothetical protein
MEYPNPSGRMRPTDAIPALAESLLRDARRLLDGGAGPDEDWRGATRFTVLRRGERNTVLRAHVPGDDDVDPPSARTLVLKLAGGDVDLADADLRHMQALTGLDIVPDVVADLGEARGFAMRDAGDDTLTRRFMADGAGGVRDGVVRMARAYARLHVEGRALMDRTASMRQAAMTRELGHWMDGLPRALAWLRIDAHDARVRRAMSRISAAWYAGREQLTLTHGDPAPGNVLFTRDGEARLVDFEYAAPRLPAYDVTAWDVLCPLPNDLLQLLRDEYAATRAALGWPLHPDGEAYDVVVAYRALALLAWLRPDGVERDRRWVEEWSVRQAALSTLDRLAERCRANGELQRLAEAAAEAAAHWRREWPAVTSVLPPWPALATP